MLLSLLDKTRRHVELCIAIKQPKPGMSDFEWSYTQVEVNWASDDQISAYYIEGRHYDKPVGKWPGKDASSFGSTESKGEDSDREVFSCGTLDSQEDILKWLEKDVNGPENVWINGRLTAIRTFATRKG